MKTKITKLTIIVLSVVLISTITVFFIKNSRKVKYTPRDPYDKTGFIEIENIKDEKLYLENDNLNFEFDVNNTQFEVKDKKTNTIWKSNPEKLNSQTPQDIDELFIVYYERKLETPKSVSVLNESINLENYMIKSSENEIDVLYKVGGKTEIQFIDLPRQISEEKFNDKIIKPLEELAKDDFSLMLDIDFLKKQYLFSEIDNTYFLRNITSIQSIKDLYELIFDKSEYTFEDYIEDSNTYKFPTEEEVPYFEFVVRYSLNDNGLEVNIINDSIYETERYPISYIDVLPYFSVGNVNDEGFTVIPDGAGLFIDHNNNKYNTPTYDKRVYGNDFSIGQRMQIQGEEEEYIKLPMYGYSVNNTGFINVLEDSEAMNSIRSSFKTTSQNGQYTNRIAQTYYRYSLRERDAFHFSSNVSTQRVSMWTNDYNKNDFKSTYIFNSDVDSYYDFVDMYKEYLKSTFNIPTIEDQNNMHITILGGYKIKKNFLGIPYNSVQALTKASEVFNILEEIDSKDINVSYQGWSNDGIRSRTNNKIKYNKNIGSRKNINRLLDRSEDEGYDLFLEYYTNTGFGENNINVNKNVSKTIFKDTVKYRKFTLSTGIVDQSTLARYYLNQNTINKVYDNIIKTSNRINNNNILLVDSSNRIHTDFSKNNVQFRDDYIKNYYDNLNKLEGKKLILRDPFLYGMVKSDIHLDLTYDTTLHRMVDYEIPFVQLVMNGLFSYYSKPINLDTYNSIDWYLLKSVETGTKPQFTLSYKDTVNLINTEYTDIFSTYYNNWLDDINYLNNELEQLGIFDNLIVNHKVLNRSGTLIEVEYNNGSKYIIDYLNETLEMIGG